MEIDRFRKEDYYNKPLSEVSWDKYHKVSLIDDKTHKACNLETLTVRACKALRGGPPLATCDAYLETNGTHWFIEFKNRPVRNIRQTEIWQKAYDSISTVRMAINQTITLDDLCENSVFLVVYKDEEETSLDATKRKVASLATKEEFLVKEEPVFPYWELTKIVGKLYREVQTIPATEFCKKLIPRIWGREI